MNYLFPEKWSRRFQREKALQSLYSFDLSSKIIEFSPFINNILIDEYEKDKLWSIFYEDFLTEHDFTDKIVRGVIDKLDFLDNIIDKYSINWPVNRIAKVDHNILRMAIYELFFFDDIPYSVTANEAVELAKTFGNEKSSKFINGILGKIIEDISSGNIS